MARANRRDVLTDREIQVVLKGPKQGASHLSSTNAVVRQRLYRGKPG